MANISFKSITFPGLANKYQVPEISNDLMTQGKAADSKATGDALSALEDQFSEETDKIKADLDTQDAYTILLNDNVPNTTQAYTFTDGKVSQIAHNRNLVAIRTDVFTYGTGTITEKRTLNTGESMTLVTNLTTLETVVTYDGGNE